MGPAIDADSATPAARCLGADGAPPAHPPPRVCNRRRRREAADTAHGEACGWGMIGIKQGIVAEATRAAARFGSSRTVFAPVDSEASD